jgi:hypothetical protein
MAYGMKLTTIGAAKLLAAATDETEITFSKIVWGNASGTAYEPTGEETALVNQIYQNDVLAVELDEEHPNVYRVDGELVSASSEFTLLEVGILDSEGDLIAIGNHPAQFVPGPSSSFTLDYKPSWFLVISSELAVAVTLAPAGDYATEEWVTANFQPKGTYVKTVTGEDGVTVTGSATDRVAKADKSWFDARYKAIDAEAPGVESVNEGWAIDITGTASDPVVAVDKATLDATYRGINSPFPLPSHTHPNATQSAAGFMSASDKTKLDGLSSGGGALFVKVAETVVSSESTYIDILNISGFGLYLVKAQGLRITPDQAADAVPEQVGVQFGNNSTLYASAGDYFDTSLAYLALNPSPSDVSKRPNQIEYTYGEGIRRATNGTTRYGHFLFTLKNFNDATKKTRIHETDNNIMELLALDEQSPKPDGQHVEGEVRTTENRLRFLLPSGKKFNAGRIAVFGIS